MIKNITGTLITPELNYRLGNSNLSMLNFLTFIIVVCLYERISLPLGNIHQKKKKISSV